MENQKRDIAVIGIALKFPQAESTEAFWNNLMQKKDNITRRRIYKNQKNEVFACGAVDGIYQFDNKFFDIPDSEALRIAPQERHILQTAYHALEDANIVPDAYNGKIGVICGSGNNEYALKNMLYTGKVSSQNDANFGMSAAAARIAYKLHLTGPCIYALSACSTSLTAVDLACRYLLSHDADVMLAGGTSIFPLEEKYDSISGVMSFDGYTRAFADNATGFVPGNGCAMLVLKRLEDAVREKDHIYSVIKATAIGNDGNRKASYVAPSLLGEYEVISSALERSGVKIDEVDYIETHGTATAIGDAIELDALRKAYAGIASEKKIAIGSVKNHIGHTDAAAGAAGLIKASLILDKGIIPPAINIHQVNSSLEKDNTFFVNQEAVYLDKSGRLLHAGVSSFGVGGENAHLILEEYREPELKTPDVKNSENLFLFSAKSRNSLSQNMRNMEIFLKEHPQDIRSAAYSLKKYRIPMEKRAFFIASPEGVLLKSDIGHFDEEKETGIVFLFPGSGTAAKNSGKNLYESCPIFRKYYTQCRDIILNITNHEIDILSDASGAEELKILSFDYASAMTLAEAGIEPDALIGHSLGEYALAAFNGTIQIEDALTLIYHRSELVKKLPAGRMISVAAPVEKIQDLLTEGVFITCYNVSDRLVITCKEEAFASFRESLISHKVMHSVLNIRSCGHTEIMHDIAEEYSEFFRNVRFGHGKYPVYSSLYGRKIQSSEMETISYWIALMEKSVLFESACTAARNDLPENAVFIETGSNDALTTFVSRIFITEENAFCFTSAKLFEDGENECHEWLGFLKLLGELWKLGIDFQEELFFDASAKRKISLPQYAFDCKNFNALEGFESALSEIDFDDTDLAELQRIQNLKDKAYHAELLTEHEEIRTAFDRLSIAGAANYFCKIGIKPEIRYSIQEIFQKGQVVEKYLPYVKFLLKVLQNANFISKEDTAFKFSPKIESICLEQEYSHYCEEIPDFRYYFELFKRCADSYPDVFNGQVIGNEILYPNGSFAYLQEIGAKTPAFSPTDTYIEILAEFIAGLMKGKKKKIYILEIGGGTAELSIPLLNRIKNIEIEYWFTDIGISFVNKAKEYFDTDTRNKMIFKPFNIEQPPEQQGIPTAYFDIVTGLDVVQATTDIRNSLKNLKKILKPAGWSMMIQKLYIHDMTQMIYGYAPGWWNYDKDALRTGNSIVASPETWQEAYTQAGFTHVQITTGGYNGKRKESSVITAMNPSTEQQLAANVKSLHSAFVPETESSVQAVQYQYGENEKVLREIIQSTIGVKDFSLESEIFAIGIDSLSILIIRSKIQEALGIDISLKSFYQFKTFHDLCHAAEQAAASKIERTEKSEKKKSLSDLLDIL